MAQHQFFWNIGHSTIEATFWTTYCKLETNVLTFSVYIHEGWTLGVYGIKLKWHWECLENPMGTWWEHSANTLRTQKKTKNISPLFEPCKERIFIYNLIIIYVIILRLSLVIYFMIGFHYGLIITSINKDWFIYGKSYEKFFSH